MIRKVSEKSDLIFHNNVRCFKTNVYFNERSLGKSGLQKLTTLC